MARPIAWTKFDKTLLPDHSPWVADDEKAIEEFNENATVDEHGIVRWESNGRIPPTDCLEQWGNLTLDFDYVGSVLAGKEETRAALAAYRANPPELSDEARFEMRAAFGMGTTVIDIITGRRTTV